MIKLYFNKNAYSFPSAWHELKPGQYLDLCTYLFEYSKGECDIDQVRAKWFCSLIGIEFKPKDDKNDLLWENIFRASREFTFFTKIEYAKSIEGVDVELRKKLRKYPPSEINFDDPMLRWVQKLKYKYVIDAVFAKNLLPYITVNDKKIYGYKLDIKSGFMNTTLTAQQFVNASEALREYYKNQDEAALNLLLHILYKSSSPETFEKIDAATKFAVLLNFQAICEFIMRKTKWSLIWYSGNSGDTPKKQCKYVVGASDAIYSLAKLGFGTIEELADMNLVRYFDLLLKNIIDSVKSLHDMEANVSDIAERTGLSIPLVTQIIEK